MKIYKPKIDWWIYLVPFFMVAGCVMILMLEGDVTLGLVIAIGWLAIWLLVVRGVKYAINGNKFGIRTFYRWTWFPINKISSIRKKRGASVQGPFSVTLSLDRLSISLSDRNILKSSMPVDVSPKDSDEFIEALKEINPDIVIN